MRFLKPDSLGGFTYFLAHPKTNQSGVERPEHFKPVVGSAASALEEWLQVAGITDGAIFRRIRKGGHLGEPLSPSAVRDIVKQRCALAGVMGDFSAHSLRSGFVTEAGARGVGRAETMALTGHRSIQTVLGYSRVNQGRPSRRRAATRRSLLAPEISDRARRMPPVVPPLVRGFQWAELIRQDEAVRFHCL